MRTTRLEAFSDGVIAIILTIMVLELKVPTEHTVEALAEKWPVVLAYCLSYLFVFRVWLMHHETFRGLETIDHAVLWANGLVLFAASFIPFSTAFAGESHWRAPVPVATYNIVMGAVSLAFVRLHRAVARCTGEPESVARHAEAARRSLHAAAAFGLAALVAAFVPRMTLVLYALVPPGILVVQKWRKQGG